ncbi:proteasome regulatory particle base subunit [Gaertneriomyces sp. JEL0708]|nr:proteasome regulatory particle base subunit [Gaertneriomyces sp. JEL0708]
MKPLHYMSSWLVMLVLLTYACAEAVQPVIKTVKVEIAGPDRTKISEVLNKNDKLSRPFKVHDSDKLSISVRIENEDGRPLEIQQLFLGARIEKTNDELTRIGAPNGKGEFVVELNMKDQRKSSLRESGKSALRLYAAGPGVIPTIRELGDVYLYFPESIVEKKHASHDREIFHALPEIRHQFSSEEKMPNKTLSLAFMALVLAPWAWFLGTYLILGANIKQLFYSGSTVIYGTAFTCALALWGALYYMYWLKFNLFQLLGYGAGLSLLTTLVGRQALIARTTLPSKQ